MSSLEEMGTLGNVNSAIYQPSIERAGQGGKLCAHYPHAATPASCQVYAANLLFIQTNCRILLSTVFFVITCLFITIPSKLNTADSESQS